MSNRIRILSLAGLCGGLGTIAYSLIFAFTHGSTSVNKMESLLGLNELEWGRIAVILPILMLAGLFAFRLRSGNRMTRFAIFGYWTAFIALAIRIVCEVPQIFINMREEYQSPLSISAWMLFLVSIPILTAGMLLLAIGCRRSGMKGSAFYAPLLVGLLAILTFIGGGIIPGLIESDDSTMSRLISGSLSIPLGLAWAWLSISPTRHTS